MRFLLDTHAVLWWLSDDRRLGEQARDIIENPANDIVVSVASLWEIVVKVKVGKLQADISEVIRALDAEAFDFLPIQPTHLQKLAELPLHHRDTFDHLLIAQAFAENATFMTEDQHAPLYAVPFIRCSDTAAPSQFRRQPDQKLRCDITEFGRSTNPLHGIGGLDEVSSEHELRSPD